MTDTNVFYRFLNKPYPAITRAEGVYMYDAAGRRYLDGSSGPVASTIGHGRREVAQAMFDQATQVEFVHSGQFTSRPQEKLADLIAAHIPRPLRYSYFVSGGSEANETAMKLARWYFLERGDARRTKIIGKWGSYHGNTLGALAASGFIARRRPYAPMLSGAFGHVPAPREAGEGCAESGLPDSCPCLRDARAVLEQEDPSSIAAVVMEPVSGSAMSGFRPHPGYFRGIQALCREYGILFILDEVMTGVGRTGRWFALEHEGLQPDMVVLAKGLAGGYAPLGAVVTTEQIYDTVRQTSGYFLHGFTYAGHPVSLAAGVAVMRIVERERLVENAQCRGEALRAGLDELAARYPHLVKQIRGVGMMQGVVLHPRPGLGDGGAGMLLASLALDEGLIVYPASGTGTTTAGDHLFVAPPLSITEAELDECLELFERSLARMEVQVEGGHMAVPGK